MPNYWLGISTNKELYADGKEDSWWCLPSTAKEGDVILLYHPRSTNPSKQGIFAECIVTIPPNLNEANNYLCYDYGFGLSHKQSLCYVTIKIRSRFNPTLTAKEMKDDLLLRKTGFVRRNFQGTSFRIEELAYNRIIKLLGEKRKGFISST